MIISFGSFFLTKTTDKYILYIEYIYNMQGEKMNIIISNANNEPIYEQIYRQIKNAIINEELKENDLLPSIRNLAKDLRISVITTKRAYDELEKDGYIHSATGKGSFVAEKNTEILRESRLRDIEEHIREILQIAPSCKLTTSEIIEMFKMIAEETP